jgi:hypothetical protein
MTAAPRSKITLAAATLACLVAGAAATPSLAASKAHHGRTPGPHAGSFARTPAQEDPDPGYQTWTPNGCWEDDGYGRRTQCDSN